MDMEIAVTATKTPIESHHSGVGDDILPNGSEKLGRQLETIAHPTIEVGKHHPASTSPSREVAATVASVPHFKSLNYKLCVSLGVSSTVLSPVRAVFDTGAGPNIVRDDILPKGWERILIPSQPLPRNANASGKRMPVRKVVLLHLQVGDP
jgi:hypothetical protein